MRAGRVTMEVILSPLSFEIEWARTDRQSDRQTESATSSSSSPVWKDGGVKCEYVAPFVTPPWLRSSTPIWIITCRLIRCSLKLECEKLATEKVEIQRHYVMVGTIPSFSAELRFPFIFTAWFYSSEPRVWSLVVTCMRTSSSA